MTKDLNIIITALRAAIDTHALAPYALQSLMVEALFAARRLLWAQEPAAASGEKSDPTRA